MDALVTLAIGVGLGWLGGFLHRGWIEEKDQRRRDAEAARRHRDHLDIRGGE